YAADVFRHPMMKEPFTYQNGGQWEWIAGRFVLAEFRGGRSEAARAHLQQMAGQAVGRGGLFEWVTRQGKGMGSARYAGSAASLGAAVLEGLFGLELRRDGLDVAVRLGTRDGQVTVEQPATGRAAGYEYRYAAASRTVRLSFRSSAPGRGRLEVLLPPGLAPAEARLDGVRTATPAVRALGEDRYVRLTTDWAPHVLELML